MKNLERDFDPTLTAIIAEIFEKKLNKLSNLTGFIEFLAGIIDSDRMH